MKKLMISLGLGLIAGILDVLPMILQGLDWYSNSSAFMQWLVLGVFINYIQVDLKGWLKGIVISLASSLPIMVLVAKNDPFSIIPIIVMTTILGSMVGFLGEKYAK